MSRISLIFSRRLKSIPLLQKSPSRGKMIILLAKRRVVTLHQCTELRTTRAIAEAEKEIKEAQQIVGKLVEKDPSYRKDVAAEVQKVQQQQEQESGKTQDEEQTGETEE